MIIKFVAAASLLPALGLAQAADVVPPEIEQPGTQPGEAGNFEDPGKCDNVTPATTT